MQDLVYNSLLENGEMTASELAELEDLSDRTYVNKLLKSLEKQGKVASKKVGRTVFYFTIDLRTILSNNLRLKNLREEDIWQAAKNHENFPKNITEEAETIFQFAFTEMLNNAIDHSKSGAAHVKIWQENNSLKFIIRDFGIGVFKSVMTKFYLEDDLTALREIIKGKRTTDPAHHSGEGIFWTSKIADRISFESFGLKLTIDNNIDDYVIEKTEQNLLGTEVYFEIKLDSKKSMSELFHQYSFDDKKLALDTTSVPIKLYEEGETWISRSQAKKVLTGLEKFKKITFDFAGIKLIGQGFADEIFRVFQIAHPEIILEAINTNDSVRLMVEHARNDSTGRD